MKLPTIKRSKLLPMIGENLLAAKALRDQSKKSRWGRFKALLLKCNSVDLVPHSYPPLESVNDGFNHELLCCRCKQFTPVNHNYVSNRGQCCPECFKKEDVK
tara:strand:- start:368 stop:673 length:306 start_codon:yes stop_codon:yes gene_type:complete